MRRCWRLAFDPRDGKWDECLWWGISRSRARPWAAAFWWPWRYQRSWTSKTSARGGRQLGGKLTRRTWDEQRAKQHIGDATYGILRNHLAFHPKAYFVVQSLMSHRSQTAPAFSFFIPHMLFPQLLDITGGHWLQMSNQMLVLCLWREACDLWRHPSATQLQHLHMSNPSEQEAES